MYMTYFQRSNEASHETLSHEHCEMLFVSAGFLQIQTESDFALNAGGILFIRAGLPHSALASPDAEIYTVRLPVIPSDIVSMNEYYDVSGFIVKAALELMVSAGKCGSLIINSEALYGHCMGIILDTLKRADFTPPLTKKQHVLYFGPDLPYRQQIPGPEF